MEEIHLPEEQPSRNKTFISFTWWFVHDVQIWWIETQSGGWKTISNLWTTVIISL